MKSNVLWFEELRKDDIPSVGGKGANLGEMVHLGINVPPGFVVSTLGYDLFLKGTGLPEKIEHILGDAELEDSASLNEASKKIRGLFAQVEIPKQLEDEILEAYSELQMRKNAQFVAVRSSATMEDLEDASFAGQQETFLNIRGDGELLGAVKKCWSSLFTPRAIFYRQSKKFAHADVKLAVVVQKMVNSRVSGVMFTREPNTGEPKTIVEAVFGLGEAIVGGEVTPDTYIIETATGKFFSKLISRQKKQIVRNDSGGNRYVELDPETGRAQKLDDKHISKLVSTGKIMESHYRKALDIEWCLEDSELYMVQARPVTTIGVRDKTPKEKTVGDKPHGEQVKRSKPDGVVKMDTAGGNEPGKVLLKGLGASPGMASGAVKIVKNTAELDKVEKGEILVSVMTTPDMVPAMAKASGIVTDEGGMTCHAAIVSRELGIPCIVGTGKATAVLRDKDKVSVDGRLGVVYEGGMPERKKDGYSPQALFVTAEVPVTATNVLVNIGIPEKAEEYARLPVRGVGLMRIEFIFTSYLQRHPLDMLKSGEGGAMVDRLAEGIAKVARAFYPRPVIVRTSDFKTNEYRGMIGGENYEPQESNPMIGWRGCSRYVSPQYREAFRCELKAIAKVRHEMGLSNAMVMLPFVRTVDELKVIIKMMEDEGLHRNLHFKLYLMAEVPSIVFLADEFTRYCDGFSIGSNDLTQLIMGADRDSEILGKMNYFDERNEAVKKAIELLIEAAHRNNIKVGICGQAPSVYHEFAEFLVRCGIDSISLNPDTVVETTRIIASAEKKLTLDKLRKH
jgi:pyruvate,water dikinase